MPNILVVLDFGDSFKVFVNDSAGLARLWGPIVLDVKVKMRAKLAYALGMTESQVKVSAHYFNCLRLWGLWA